MPTKKKPAKKPAKKQVKSPRPKQAAPKEEDLMLKMDSIPTGKLSKEAGVQPFLFGEADQILNALETELSEWKSTYERLDSGMERLIKKMEAAEERIEALSSAVEATRRHAPMTEDPSLPLAVKNVVEKVVQTISHPTEIPENQPEAETTTSRDEGAAENTISGVPSLLFRTPTQPIPELLFPGDIIITNWETGPYRIEEIGGPYNTVEGPPSEGIMSCPDHWSLKCSALDAKRTKEGKLPKNYNYYYINLVLAVGNRFLSVFAASDDEIMLTAESVQKEKMKLDGALTPLGVAQESEQEDLF